MVVRFLISIITSGYCSIPSTGFGLVVLEVKEAKKQSILTRGGSAAGETGCVQKELLFEPRIELGTFSVLD